MKLSIKAVAPVVVLGVAGAVTAVMFASHAPVEQISPEVHLPLVEVAEVRTTQAQLSVSAQGTVMPRTETDLVAEVAGRVVWVSPRLAAGGFFAEGEALARVDARDYEIALEGALAALARSESDRAHAESTLVRQRSMRGSGASSMARLDDALHAAASAEAGIREAQVAVTRAKLDLGRTEIVAPFVGRLRDKHIDVGQFIARGSPVARIYAVDYVEVRLPIADEDAAFLDLPLGYRGDPSDGSSAVELQEGAEVVLSARFAGRRNHWRGRVVRTEGALDPRTRMITVVARVEDPYGRGGDPESPPLPVGLFVDAEIRGRVVEGVIELPRAALRERDETVIVVEDGAHLRLRRVEVLRTERDRVWVRSGLEPGELVVTTPVDVFVEGMKVRTRIADTRPAAAARSTADSAAKPEHRS